MSGIRWSDLPVDKHICPVCGVMFGWPYTEPPICPNCEQNLMHRICQMRSGADLKVLMRLAEILESIDTKDGRLS